ncbi:hypothetical protein NQ314_005242 [Rhamnusium bicolor]|uniref:Cyclin-dependent kinase inhibitor domain-containing protein n=1 Tax=Rhamnusium bicolor TaxID=1586634 RepID=A0AAV8ZK53_9CUCU|nr:hypothetical protein NQ314_005242 [Rhamnusium bicolor]
MADTNHEQETREEKDNEKKLNDEQSTEKSKVCKRLDFGTENAIRENELNNFLCQSAEDMHEQRQKAIEKWNFDFENEVPLDGDWVWEKIPVRAAENKEVVSTMEKKHSENRTV